MAQNLKYALCAVHIKSMYDQLEIGHTHMKNNLYQLPDIFILLASSTTTNSDFNIFVTGDHSFNFCNLLRASPQPFHRLIPEVRLLSSLLLNPEYILN